MRKRKFSPPVNRWKARCSKWRITGHNRHRAGISWRALLLAWRLSAPRAGQARGGLPTPEMLEVLQNAGARIFRTDTDGATTVEWKEGSLVVRTYRGTETVVMGGDSYPLSCPTVNASR